MKRILLTFAGSLFIGLAAVSAQITQDTSSNPVRQGDPAIAQPPAQGTEDMTQDRDVSYRTQSTVIQSTEVPASLRTTLKSSEYTGWENGKVYRSNANDGYVVEVGEGTSMKTYRFDKNGKRLKDNSTPKKDY